MGTAAAKAIAKANLEIQKKSTPEQSAKSHKGKKRRFIFLDFLQYKQKDSYIALIQASGHNSGHFN